MLEALWTCKITQEQEDKHQPNNNSFIWAEFKGSMAVSLPPRSSFSVQTAVPGEFCSADRGTKMGKRSDKTLQADSYELQLSKLLLKAGPAQPPGRIHQSTARKIWRQ